MCVNDDHHQTLQTLHDIPSGNYWGRRRGGGLGNEPDVVHARYAAAQRHKTNPLTHTLPHTINGLLVLGIGKGQTSSSSKVWRTPQRLTSSKVWTVEDSTARVKRKPVWNGCTNRPTPDLPSNRRPLNLQGDGGTFEEKFINRSN